MIGTTVLPSTIMLNCTLDGVLEFPLWGVMIPLWIPELAVFVNIFKDRKKLRWELGIVICAVVFELLLCVMDIGLIHCVVLMGAAVSVDGFIYAIFYAPKLHNN